MTIRFTKEIVFKDREGNVLKAYGVGDTALATAKTAHYFVTPMGGIYFDEAVEL